MKTFKSFIILCLFLTSCNSTGKLWKKSYYQDEIKDFLVTTDGSKIVFLGKKYHYIFDDKSESLKTLLSWKDREILQITRLNFELESSSKISGYVTVSTSNKDNKSLTNESKKFLEELGFSIVKNKNNSNSFQKEIYLSGTRYLPEPGVNYETKSSLNKNYILSIQDNSLYDKSKKIALTPLTVTGDTISIALGIGIFAIVIAIALPVVFIACMNPNAGGLCGTHK